MSTGQPDPSDLDVVFFLVGLFLLGIAVILSATSGNSTAMAIVGGILVWLTTRPRST